jgi:tRNA threonylcarbamoyladenosine biosynthesis protein TsaE
VDTATWTVEADTLTATENLGRRLGEILQRGMVVALIGPLGAGKTHFSRAVAEGLGMPQSHAVTSPTFVLIQEYTGGRLPIYHLDTYRLGDPEVALSSLGVEEYFSGDGGILPADRLRVVIDPLGESVRSFTFQGTGPDSANLVRRLAVCG